MHIPVAEKIQVACKLLQNETCKICPRLFALMKSYMIRNSGSEQIETITDLTNMSRTEKKSGFRSANFPPKCSILRASNILQPLYITFSNMWRCPWCSHYRRRKWTRRHEFKSSTRLIAFHIALIPLGKV